MNNVESKEEQWNYYIDSFVMSSPTEGIPTDRVHTPFVRKNLPSEEDETNEYADTEIKANLEIKICVNTYKMFYQSSTEDVFIQNSKKRAVDSEKSQRVSQRRKKRWDDWLSKTVKDIKTTS